MGFMFQAPKKSARYCFYRFRFVFERIGFQTALAVYCRILKYRWEAAVGGLVVQRIQKRMFPFRLLSVQTGNALNKAAGRDSVLQQKTAEQHAFLPESAMFEILPMRLGSCRFEPICR